MYTEFLSAKTILFAMLPRRFSFHVKYAFLYKRVDFKFSSYLLEVIVSNA